MNPTLRKLLLCIPALAWMGMIFVLSSQPGGDSGAFSRMVLEWLASIGLDLRLWFGDQAFFIIRKLAHFTEYFILFALINLALSGSMTWQRRRWWAIGLVFLYACSDEFHQLFVPRRIGDVQDVLIDTLGGAVALLLGSLIWMFRRKKAQRVSASSQRK